MGALLGAVSDALEARPAVVAARVVEGVVSFELRTVERSVGLGDTFR